MYIINISKIRNKTMPTVPIIISRPTFSSIIEIGLVSFLGIVTFSVLFVSIDEFVIF